jgi:hypothetical protein
VIKLVDKKELLLERERQKEQVGFGLFWTQSSPFSFSEAKP